MAYSCLTLKYIFVVMILNALICLLILLIDIWIICIIEILILTVIIWFLIYLTALVISHKLRICQLIWERVEIQLTLSLIDLVVTIDIIVQRIGRHLNLWSTGESSMPSTVGCTTSWARYHEMLLCLLRLVLELLCVSCINVALHLKPRLSTFHRVVMLLGKCNSVTTKDLVISTNNGIGWLFIVDSFESPIKWHRVLFRILKLFHKRAWTSHLILKLGRLAKLNLILLEMSPWMLNWSNLIVLYHSLSELTGACHWLHCRHICRLVLVLSILVLIERLWTHHWPCSPRLILETRLCHLLPLNWKELLLAILHLHLWMHHLASILHILYMSWHLSVDHVASCLNCRWMISSLNVLHVFKFKTYEFHFFLNYNILQNGFEIQNEWAINRHQNSALNYE